MATDAVRKSDENEAFALNLTPMIDVVFQLIIFFMCAMKFKTLEKKIEAFLPKDRGLAKTPDRIEEKVTIKVVIKQGQNEGVPHFYLFNEDVGRTAADNGVGRLRSDAKLARNAAEIKKYEAEHRAFWDRYIEPKIKLLQQRIDDTYKRDPTLPGQIDADAYVRHEYVIAVLDAFMEAGMTEITFVGEPPKRPGS
jgi:biopolymer transport protein ExbD